MAISHSVKLGFFWCGLLTLDEWAGEHGSLREMKARICPSGKLLWLWTYKTIEAVYKGQQPNLFFQLGRYEPSPPSTKELHEWTNIDIPIRMRFSWPIPRLNFMMICDSAEEERLKLIPLCEAQLSSRQCDRIGRNFSALDKFWKRIWPFLGFSYLLFGKILYLLW